MDLYREQILDHYKHPRNFGHIDHPDVVQEEGNVTCGDRVVLEIAFEGKGKLKKVKAIAFWGEGCAISQASASMLTEMVKTMKIDDVKKITPNDVFDMLGTTLTPSRTRCALLSLEVLQKAL